MKALKKKNVSAGTVCPLGASLIRGNAVKKLFREGIGGGVC